MSGSVNHVNYDALATAAKDYGDVAQMIDDLLKKLMSTNSVLEGAWINKTSEAFLERFEREYKPAMTSLQSAVSSLSSELTHYINNHQSDDAQYAAQFR